MGILDQMVTAAGTVILLKMVMPMDQTRAVGARLPVCHLLLHLVLDSRID